MSKKEYIDSRFDLEGLREIGLLTTENTYEEIENRIVKYFGFKTIYDYDHMMDPKPKPVKFFQKTFSDN